MKETNIPAKIINPCQFITDPLNSSKIITHTLKHLDNYIDSSFENESTKCKVIAVMIAKGCMKAVTSKTGWAILQNSY